VTDRGTLAVVVSGRGQDAARQAASYWMPRARWLALAGAGPGTGLVDPGTVILDGDLELQTLAARGAPANTPTERAKVATVAEATLGETARATLASSGFAAWDAHVDTWRQAAKAMGGVTIVCHGVTSTAANDQGHRDLQADVKPGGTGRTWWRTALGWLSPSTRREQRATDEQHRDAVRAAASCAVAALLGPR
jgi:hypothetical protein